MSYRNPQVYFADTQAFSKGFEESFGKFQQKFEEERLEKERIAKEQDEALAGAYKSSDLSAIAGLDARMMDGLQSSIDAIVTEGSFATASASEQAKMLRKVSSIKGTIGRLGELAQIDNKDWDARNSPKLGALKAAMTRGDKSIKIEGKGLDLKVIGDFGEVSLDELSSAKFMKRSDYEEDYKGLNSGFRTKADSIFKEAAKLGLPVEDIEKKLSEQFMFMLKNEDSPGLLSYLYSNKISSATQREGGSMYYNDPDVVSGFKSIEEKDAFSDKQFTLMANELAQKEIGSLYNYSDFAAAYKMEKDREYGLKIAALNNSSRSVKSDKVMTQGDVKYYAQGQTAIEGLSMLDDMNTLRDNWGEMKKAFEKNEMAEITGTKLGNLIKRLGYSVNKPIGDNWRITKAGHPSIELNVRMSDDQVKEQLKLALEYVEQNAQNMIGPRGFSIYDKYGTQPSYSSNASTGSLTVGESIYQ